MTDRRSRLLAGAVGDGLGVTDSRSRLVAVTANNLRSYQPLANRASQPFSVMPKTGTIPASEEP